MKIYGWLILALWLTLIAYWAVAARRSIGGRWIWWREIGLRLGFFALLVQALLVTVADDAAPTAWLYASNSGRLTGLVGLLLCASGIGLAILGRVYLSRNPGVAGSNRGATVLVTSGPYGFVRHPIYGGMLVAMLGSAIGQSVLWLLPLIVYGPYFVRSARHEEALLVEQFPESYPSYMKQTKMLLPFLL